MTTAKRRDRGALDAERIVAAGIELADAEGASSLTMRALADRLGFKVMALYNHVANKDELLALMVDEVAGRIELPAVDGDALVAIRAHAVATRAILVAHPWSPLLWQRYLPGPNRIDHMERLLAAFDRSGLPADLAHHGFHAVDNHVLGYTLRELSMELDGPTSGPSDAIEAFLASVSTGEYPHTVRHVQQHIDGDTASSFELVLDLILDGLVAMAADRS